MSSAGLWASDGLVWESNVMCPEGTEHFDRLGARYGIIKTHVRPYHITSNSEELMWAGNKTMRGIEWHLVQISVITQTGIISPFLTVWIGNFWDEVIRLSDFVLKVPERDQLFMSRLTVMKNCMIAFCTVLSPHLSYSGLTGFVLSAHFDIISVWVITDIRWRCHSMPHIVLYPVHINSSELAVMIRTRMGFHNSYLAPNWSKCSVPSGHITLIPKQVNEMPIGLLKTSQLFSSPSTISDKG